MTLLRHFGLCKAAAHSDFCFFAPCTNILTYLLTYLLMGIPKLLQCSNNAVVTYLAKRMHRMHK